MRRITEVVSIVRSQRAMMPWLFAAVAALSVSAAHAAPAGENDSSRLVEDSGRTADRAESVGTSNANPPPLEPKQLRPFVRASIGLGYAMTWGFYEAPIDYESNFRGAVPDFALSLGAIFNENASVHGYASHKLASLAGDNLDDVEGLYSGFLGSYFRLTTVGAGAAYYSSGSSFALSGKIGAVHRQVGQVFDGPSFIRAEDTRLYTSKRWGVEFEFEPAASILVSDRVAIGAGVGLGAHIIPASGDPLIYGWHLSPRFIIEWR